MQMKDAGTWRYEAALAREQETCSRIAGRHRGFLDVRL